VRFNPVPTNIVQKFLENRGAPKPDLAAELGRGSVGLSLRYAEDPEFGQLRGAVFRAGFAFSEDFEGRHEAVGEIVGRAEAVGAARERESLSRLEEPDRRAKDGAKRAGRAAREGALRESLELLAFLYRDAAVVEAGAEELVANTDRMTEIRDYVDRYRDADWAGAARSLGEARAALAYNVSPEATLEVTLSRIRRKILAPSRGSSTSGSLAGA
jgi:DNA polymerase-3 subunit delta'